MSKETLRKVIVDDVRRFLTKRIAEKQKEIERAKANLANSVKKPDFGKLDEWRQWESAEHRRLTAQDTYLNLSRDILELQAVLDFIVGKKEGE